MLAGLKKAIYRSPFLYRRFNNTLNPLINLHYERFGRACRKAFEDREGRSLWDKNNDVSRRGSIRIDEVMPQSLAGEYSRKLGDLLSKTNQGVTEEGNQNFIALPRPVTLLGRAVIDIFSEERLNTKIKEFFGSNFRIAWLDCYRSVPTEQRDSSWLWHSDKVPSGTLKAMLLLTEATEDLGATQFFSREHTNMYRRKGYWGEEIEERLSDLTKFAKDNNLPYEPYSNDARPGDVLLFDNNNLHKAVPPKRAYRDALTYLLLPSQEPWDIVLQQEGLASIENKSGGYPLTLG